LQQEKKDLFNESKIGAKVVRLSCYVVFQMAEVAVSRQLAGAAGKSL
jgi:hypothetical protein